MGFITEPFHIYREKSKTNLSSHFLGDFRACPLLYKKKKSGLIADVDSPALLIGRAAHTLILEGRKAYQDGYAFGGPINPKTQKPYGSTTKKYLEWAEAQKKPVLTQTEDLLIEHLNGGVQANKEAKRLLKEGRAETVVRVEYCGVPCQIRIDWYNNGIKDLKSCADLTWFEQDAKRYGYIHQMAFYRAVLETATGKREPVHFIAVEKKEPYRCGVWEIGQDVLAIAQQENEAAIQRLKKCVQTKTWNTGYEEIRTIVSL